MPEQHANAASAVPASGQSEHIQPDEPRIDAAWARIRGRLRDEVGEAEYRTWLRQLTLAGIEGEEAVIHVPSRFLRDWLRGQYGDRLRALWQAEAVGVRRGDIRLATANGPARAAKAETVGSVDGTALTEPLAATRPAEDAKSEAPKTDGRGTEMRGDWAAPLDPRFTFDSFIVGKPNEFAHACAR